MINLILSILILHYIGLFIFKPKNTALSCGIFGYVGKTSPNISDLKILGLYNQSRGEHACGIYINNQLIHGNQDKKLWTSFIEGTNFPEPKTNYTVIAHTRKASIGGQNPDFTHPYSIKFEEDKRKLPNLVGVHNGTLRNWIELCKEYNVNAQGLNDSKALFTILAKDPKNYKVLSKYTGGAAIMLTNPKEPNTLYVFKGATGSYYNDLPDVPEKSNYVNKFGKNFYNSDVDLDISSSWKGERPLFMYDKGDGIYFSSIEDSLFAIGGDNSNVFPVPVNKLLKFKNGELVETTKIKRPEYKAYTPTPQTPAQKQLPHSKSNQTSTKTLSLENDPLNPTILANLREICTDIVYYFKGQYWLGDKVIPNGVYSVDILTGKIEVKDQINSGYVEEFGFFNGQLLIIPEDVETLNNNKKISNMELSMYTFHPILLDSGKTLIHNKKRITGIFETFFGRSVTITCSSGTISTIEYNNDRLEESIEEFIEETQDKELADWENLDTPTVEELEGNIIKGSITTKSSFRNLIEELEDSFSTYEKELTQIPENKNFINLIKSIQNTYTV